MHVERLTFTSWLMATYDYDFTGYTKYDVQKYCTDLLLSDLHSGDCTKQNTACLLCELQSLLEEYYQYCKDQ